MLGGGGLTGLAWLSGALEALPPVLETADEVVATSAGAVLAARMLNGLDGEGWQAHLAAFAAVRLRVSAVVGLLAAQVWPSRRRALQWLGRRAQHPGPLTPQGYLEIVQRAIGSTVWPDHLVVVAVDAAAGRPSYFTARSEVPLAAAVAASCAVPGVLPPVSIDGRDYIDGSLRSPANAHLIADCDRVLVLAPQWRSVRASRLPTSQVSRLRAHGAQVVLVQSDLSGLATLTPSALKAARQAGRVQGAEVADQVERLWA